MIVLEQSIIYYTSSVFCYHNSRGLLKLLLTNSYYCYHYCSRTIDISQQIPPYKSINHSINQSNDQSFDLPIDRSIRCFDSIEAQLLFFHPSGTTYRRDARGLLQVREVGVTYSSQAERSDISSLDRTGLTIDDINHSCGL